MPFCGVRGVVRGSHLDKPSVSVGYLGMTTPPIDPAAILVAHEHHTAHPGSFTRCAIGFPDAGPCLPYRLAELAQKQAAALASAWDEGAEAQAKAYGMDKDTGPNPYRALAGEQPKPDLVASPAYVKHYGLPAGYRVAESSDCEDCGHRAVAHAGGYCLDCHEVCP